MRHRLACLTLVLAFTSASTAAHGGGLSFTANMDGDQAVITCADIDMKFWKSEKGDLVNVRRDEEINVSFPTASALRVRAAHHGGIRVQAAEGSTPTAVVCMVAAARSGDVANAMLDQVQVVNSGGELRVTGPEGDWAAYIILSVPKGVSLDLEAENGGLDMHGVTGKFALRTTNGPISLVQVAGEVDGEAQNGPISYSGHAGDVRLVSQNGPIGVKLDAASWSGKGLEASTQNGPLDFSAPEEFKSGVEIETSQNSPFSWNGSTRNGQRWDRDRNFRMGDGPVLVRLSTVNGPMTIKGGSLQKKTTTRSRRVTI